MDGQRGADLIGTVLQDSYRITRLIGAGGMGSVYEGLQLRLGKRVAVKVMARELAANEEALARFQREAEITSQLGHPHIVNVFDFGVAPSGEPYLLMEYMEGEDLEHRLRRVGRLELFPALHIVRQITSALTATHENGIVHRDLKPANVFLLRAAGESDFAKVVDFGISKAMAAATKLTRAAAIMGTPQYMSPEQALGKTAEVDHRTDQWALACIVYEMLEGRPPFVGDNVHVILYQVAHEDVPPMESMTDRMVEVEQVLRRALSKRRDDRFASIGDFTAALDSAAEFVDDRRTPAPLVASKHKETLQYVTPAPVLLPQKVGGGKQSKTEILATTLSNTNGELVVPMTGTAGRGKRGWLAAAVVGVVLLVGGVMFFRKRPVPAELRSPAGAAAPMPKPAELPIATPPLAPAQTAAPTPAPKPAAAPVPVQPTTAPSEAGEPSENARGPKRPRTRASSSATEGPSRAREKNTAPARTAKPKAKPADEIGF
jgi:serine/threonine protein kinase